jgi:FkbM family methyltransferase
MNKIKINSNGLDLVFNIRDDADESVFGEIFKHGEYRIVEEIVRDAKDAVIDVGAHAGFFTLFAWSLNRGVRIISIEPEPGNLKALQRHISDNNAKNITVYEGAVGASSGRRHLYLAKDNHNHYLVDRGQNVDKSIIVNSWSLSEIMKKSIINSVSLIKIDVEGGEYEIFKGLDESDFKKIKNFYIEYHENGKKKREEIENRLRENGFGVRVFPSKFDKKMGFIFANNKRNKIL